MPKKVVFSKEKILKASFELFKNKGIEGISARKVAKQLGSSPAPIYSCFASIEELKLELIKMSKDVLREYLTQELTEFVFLNVGMGICRFAREEKKLFKNIFLKDNSDNTLFEMIKELIFTEIEKDKRFSVLNEKEKTDLFKDCFLYTIGLSTFIVTNAIKNPTDAYIEERLLKAPATLMYNTIEEKKKSKKN